MTDPRPDPDPHPDADDALVAELRGLFARHDPVPGYVTEAAKAAFELRDLDAQLAELLRDSAVEDRELAGVRGSAARLLTFAVGDGRFVELDVTADGDRRVLAGYVVPAAPGCVAVQHPDGTLHAELDDHGRFSVSGVPAGPLRLRLECRGAATVVTEWLPL